MARHERLPNTRITEFSRLKEHPDVLFRIIALLYPGFRSASEMEFEPGNRIAIRTSFEFEFPRNEVYHLSDLQPLPRSFRSGWVFFHGNLRVEFAERSSNNIDISFPVEKFVFVGVEEKQIERTDSSRRFLKNWRIILILLWKLLK